MLGHAPPCRVLGRSAFQVRLPSIHELPLRGILGNWASGIAFARTLVVPRIYESRSPGRLGGGQPLALLSSSGTVDGFGSGISRVPFGTPLLAPHVPSECLLSSEGVAPKARLRVSALRSIMFVSLGHATPRSYVPHPTQ